MVYEVLGPEKSNALQVNEKPKGTCWKAFLDASEDVLTAFADLGVKKSGDVLMPILTDKPLAPEAVIEIRLCKCKTGCSNMRYKCKKNSFVLQKCVYVLDAKTLLLTRMWSAHLHIMTMVKIIECKIKSATEQDKQVREYV